MTINKVFSKKLILSCCFLLLAGWLSTKANIFIGNLTINRPIIPDLLHNSLPVIPEFGYVADLVVIFSFILLLGIASKNKHKIPYYISLLSSLYFLRAIIILLNPVGDSFAEHGYLGIFPGSNLSQGMFPSGHTATVFLIFLLLEKNTPTKNASFLLFILEVISLLISRGHYSIDIIGGMLLAYSLYKIFEDNFSTILIHKNH